MYYIKENNDMLEKYQVGFDEEKIKKLKCEVINNCSEIHHYDYQALMQPYPESKNSEIRNYSCKRVGYIDDFYGDFILYHFTYDEYKYPHLVTLIDELLSGNTDCLGEIYNPDLEKEKFSIKDEINRLSNEIDNIDSLNVLRKRKKLEEMNQLLSKAKLNENQKSPLEYYLELQNLIKLELIDIISKEEVLKVNKFFEKSGVKKEKIFKI